MDVPVAGRSDERRSSVFLAGRLSPAAAFCRLRPARAVERDAARASGEGVADVSVLAPSASLDCRTAVLLPRRVFDPSSGCDGRGDSSDGLRSSPASPELDASRLVLPRLDRLFVGAVSPVVGGGAGAGTSATSTCLAATASGESEDRWT
ncbi:MAG: hypothetical protein ACE5EX_07715, partial [Phycisphaerae bacterium]